MTVYFKEVFEKYADVFEELGIEETNGLGDVYAKIKELPAAQQEEIEAAIMAVYATRPELAMVDSDRGITNLHVPSDVIVDASMPAAIRASGKMWGTDGKLHDTKAMIPDRCYAEIFQETIEFCKENGAFDVKTMGSVSNVGLMAQKRKSMVLTIRPSFLKKRVLFVLLIKRVKPCLSMPLKWVISGACVRLRTLLFKTGLS